MSMGRVFAVGSILWSLAACIGYAWGHRWHSALYWLLAAAITTLVTFGRLG